MSNEEGEYVSFAELVGTKNDVHILELYAVLTYLSSSADKSIDVESFNDSLKDMYDEYADSKRFLETPNGATEIELDKETLKDTMQPLILSLVQSIVGVVGVDLFIDSVPRSIKDRLQTVTNVTIQSSTDSKLAYQQRQMDALAPPMPSQSSSNSKIGCQLEESIDTMADSLTDELRAFLNRQPVLHL